MRGMTADAPMRSTSLAHRRYSYWYAHAMVRLWLQPILCERRERPVGAYALPSRDLATRRDRRITLQDRCRRFDAPIVCGPAIDRDYRIDRERQFDLR